MSLLKKITFNTKTIAFLFLIVALNSTRGWSEDKAADKTADKVAAKVVVQDTLIVKARILEIAGTFPPNDLYNYAYVMKYRVLKVIKGKCADEEIYVGHYNPRIPRASIKDKMDALVDGDVTKFEEGDIQTLVLLAPLEKYWADATEDEYFDIAPENKFYAIKCDKAK